MVLIHKVKQESRHERELHQWSRFEKLLERGERDGLSSFRVDESETIFSLQRMLTMQLVQARTAQLDRERERYLDSLVKRGNSLLYPESRDFISEIKYLIFGGFAVAFRQTAKLQGLAWLLFLGGAFIGFFLTRIDLEYAYPLVGLMYPSEFLQVLIESPSERDSFLQLGRDSGAGEQSLFFTALFLNNLRAAMAAFCFGIFFGVPTVLILLLNGALLGSFTAIFHQLSFNFEFWAWVLPHAIPEVAAVCIAAAAGFSLGLAVIDPGDFSRRYALSRSGRASAKLMGLAALLLLYAAFIEAFIRQSSLSEGFRFSLALVHFLSVVAYLAFAGLVPVKQRN